MNEKLDGRLRAAATIADANDTTDILERATRSRRRPLHDWLNTSTPASRRGVMAVAGAAVVALALPLTFPHQSTLFALSSTNNVTSASTDAYGIGDEKMMMMPYVVYNYVAGDTLSREVGSGTVYRFELSGNLTDRAREIARAFDVEGTPEKVSYFDDTYPTWVVGPEDGSAPSVTISWSGTGSWWFNNPAAYPELECLDAGQAGDVVGDDASLQCSEYAEPITGLNPTESDAIETAFALFSQLGYSGAKSDLTTYRDDWGTTVTAPVMVDGQRIALDWSMNWSGNGEIAYVTGQSSTTVSAGTFGTVSAADAVTRLDDWRWYGSAPMDGVPWMSARSYSVGVDDAQATDGAEGTTNPVVEPTSDSPAPEPLPTETVDPTEVPVPEPSPTVMDLIIDTATPQLLMVWDNTGNAWLVPGFVMSGDEGWPLAVICLVDGVIELPEPMPIEPMIID